jgi:hypothetical protein
MKRITTLLVPLVAIVGALSLATAGWTYWTTTGTGSGSVAVGTLAAPTNVRGTSTAGTGTVNLFWTGVPAPNGVSADLGYWVQRSKEASPYIDACFSSHASPLKPSTISSCSDTGLTAGSYTYTVTAVFKSWTAQSGPSASITVSTIGAPAKLAFTQHPSGSTGGVAFTTQPVVAVQDANGNTVITHTSSVSLAITNPTGATLSCTANPKAAVAGIATFAGCKIDKAGTYTLTATAASLTAAISNSLTVSAGAAAKFAFRTSPVSGTASNSATLGPITVQAQDLGGNPANAGAGGIPVTLSSNSTGTKIFAAASGGPSVGSGTIPSGSSTVNFYYADTNAGSPVITASGTLTSATQTETITAASPSVLGYTNCKINNGACAGNGSGATVLVGNAGTYTANVGIFDAFGNPATWTGPLTINLTGNPMSGTLTPTSLTINTGSSVTSSAFGYQIPNGNPPAATVTAVAGGQSWTAATVTVNKN